MPCTTAADESGRKAGRPVSRRYLFFALAARAVIVTFGAALVAAVVCWHDAGAKAIRQINKLILTGPKAIVEQPEWDLGVIESPGEFKHSFIIRNEGNAPLLLSRGPSTCSCTVGKLPEKPIPPGGRAEVNVAFSNAAKKNELKAGPFSEGVTIRTNDPDRGNIFLKMSATVRRPLEIKPSPITLIINAAEDASAEKRSAAAFVYSQSWDHFDLAAVNKSREGMKWRIDPATEEQLKQSQARSGYHVVVTLPPDMADGEFKEWLELSAKPADAIGQPREMQLEIQGKIEGRLTIFGAKVDSNQVLRLGALNEGQSAKETLLMKVNDPRRSLSIKRIESEPEFLRVQVFPLAGESANVGLYRIEVQIPGSARACDYMGAHAAVIRIKTDHPRLPEIDLKVSFAVVESKIHALRIAGR